MNHQEFINNNGEVAPSLPYEDFCECKDYKGHLFFTDVGKEMGTNFT